LTSSEDSYGLVYLSSFLATLDRYGSFLGYALSTVDRRGGRARMIRLLGSSEVLKKTFFLVFSFLPPLCAAAMRA
jgi:hypothetical protein